MQRIGLSSVIRLTLRDFVKSSSLARRNRCGTEQLLEPFITNFGGDYEANGMDFGFRIFAWGNLLEAPCWLLSIFRRAPNSRCLFRGRLVTSLAAFYSHRYSGHRPWPTDAGSGRPRQRCLARRSGILGQLQLFDWHRSNLTKYGGSVSDWASHGCSLIDCIYAVVLSELIIAPTLSALSVESNGGSSLPRL